MPKRFPNDVPKDSQIKIENMDYFYFFYSRKNPAMICKNIWSDNLKKSYSANTDFRRIINISNESYSGVQLRIIKNPFM